MCQGLIAETTSGLLVTTPRLFVPSKNSTVSTVPSRSRASAKMPMLAGAIKEAPLSGLTICTKGGILVPTGPSAIATAALLGVPIRYWLEAVSNGEGMRPISTVSVPSNKLSGIGVMVMDAERAPLGIVIVLGIN